jgi:hypothetical protein
MKSAIYYPDIEITNEATMRSALLLWDEVKVIVPHPDFKPQYQDKQMAEAWELIGGTMYPDDVQKQQAHSNIEELLEGPTPVDVLYRDDSPQDQYVELWPQKLLPETMQMLRERQYTSAPLANGDYPFSEPGSLVVMAKLADACAGNVFARWTDRFLAFGLIADRDSASSLQPSILPMALSTIDATRIPLQKLIEYRKRELKERDGAHYVQMRHLFADTLSKHAEDTKNVASQNQLDELRRQFQMECTYNIGVLAQALEVNSVNLVLSPVIVTSTIAVGSWFGLGHHLAALAATGAATEVIKAVAELFRSGSSFSDKQREIMAKNPMAYLYQLSRA